MKFIKLITIILEIFNSLILDREKENVLALGESGFILLFIKRRLSTNKEV